MDPLQFRRACAKFATGVAVATASGEDSTPHGMTVNSFTSVSLDPPLVLMCVDHSSNLFELFRRCSHYGINVLNAHQEELSNRFAQRGFDRFDGVEWHRGRTGVPLLGGAIAQFECEVRHRVEAGDHTILIAEALYAEWHQGTPVIYFDSGYRRIK